MPVEEFIRAFEGFQTFFGIVQDFEVFVDSDHFTAMRSDSFQDFERMSALAEGAVDIGTREVGDQPFGHFLNHNRNVELRRVFTTDSFEAGLFGIARHRGRPMPY